MVLPFSTTSRLPAILITICDVLVGAPVFIFVAYKMNLFTDIMGKEIVNRILKKITFGKIQIK